MQSSNRMSQNEVTYLISQVKIKEDDVDSLVYLRLWVKEIYVYALTELELIRRKVIVPPYAYHLGKFETILFYTECYFKSEHFDKTNREKILSFEQQTKAKISCIFTKIATLVQHVFDNFPMPSSIKEPYICGETDRMRSIIKCEILTHFTMSSASEKLYNILPSKPLKFVFWCNNCNGQSYKKVNPFYRKETKTPFYL